MISAIGSVFIGYFKLIAQYNIINKEQIKNVIMLSIAIVVDVLGNLLLIPIWGINGAALATGLGNLVCGLVFVIWFARRSKIKWTELVFLQKSDLSLIRRIFRK